MDVTSPASIDLDEITPDRFYLAQGTQTSVLAEFLTGEIDSANDAFIHSLDGHDVDYARPMVSSYEAPSQSWVVSPFM